jgi:hypothetical protein
VNTIILYLTFKEFWVVACLTEILRFTNPEYL